MRTGSVSLSTAHGRSGAVHPRFWNGCTCTPARAGNSAGSAPAPTCASTGWTPFRPTRPHRDTQKNIQPQLVSRITDQADRDRMAEPRKHAGLQVLAKLVLHTGHDVDQLTSDDFDDYRQWGLQQNGLTPPGIVPAWDLLRRSEILPKTLTFKAHLHARATLHRRTRRPVPAALHAGPRCARALSRRASTRP